MKRVLLIGVGLLITLAGVIFALQGVGAMGGGAMSGVTFWAIAGPVIALAGLAVVTVGLRRRSAYGDPIPPARHRKNPQALLLKPLADGADIGIAHAKLLRVFFRRQPAMIIR